MSLTVLIVVVHIFATIAMVGGMIGRQVTRSQMDRTTELKLFTAFSDLAGRFENLLVRPGSLFVAASGILLAYLEGYPLFGFLQGGTVNWLLVANLLVLSIVATIVFIFVPRGKGYEQKLAEAENQNQVTPALRASLTDPVVVWAHRWENLATIAVIVLMIAKPI